MAISSRGEMGVGGGSRGGSGGGSRRPAPPKEPKPKNPAITVRSQSVDMGTKRVVTQQNKAAESYKIKDLDKYEKGQKLRAAKKAADAAAKAKALKKAETKGKIKGAAATVGLGSAMKLATFTKEDKNKSKTTAKAKKPLTASEKAFVKNQKEKAKATKRTGVYPNTAN